nr:hypothetical protein BaRGS_005200 [Batillaria attramentaria]
MKLLYITVSSVLIGVVAGFTWTSHTPNGTRITNCVGDNVTLHWSFETSPGEIIQSVRWFVYNEGAQAEKPLANYVFGVFFKMPSVKTRVEFLANAGIQLFNVSARDFGTYVLRVSLSRNRFLVTEEQWAVISLPDKPVLAEGRLVAMVLPETRFSEDTQEHHVQLECGRVLNDDQSDISVVWTTPHGKTLESSYYKDGVFILLLPNPVVGGAYSCRLDKVSTNINCLRDDKALTQPSFVHVDGMASRLAVVEAGLRTLKQDPDVGVDGAQVRLKLLEASQQTLVQEKLLLTQRVRTLEASHQSLTDHVQSLEEGQVFLNESLAETQQALTDGDDSLDKKVENLEASQQSLTEDSQRLSGQMQSVEASQQSLTEEDSRLSKLIQTLTEDNGRLKEQNQKLTDQLQNVTTAIRDYNNDGRM